MAKPSDFTILVTMMDVPTLTSFRDLFELENFNVVTASSAEDGIQLIRDTESIHLVILELLMPALDPPEFIQTAQSLSQRATLPFVGIAPSYYLAPDYYDGLKPQLVHLLRRPIDMDEFIFCVDDALHKTYGHDRFLTD